MQVKAKANWQQSFFHKNALQDFSLKGVLLRILIYSGVMVNLLLPFYDFNSNGFPVLDPSRVKLVKMINESQAMDNINALKRAQEAYYKERGYFSDSIEELGLKLRDTKIYSYRILSGMSHYRPRVFILAQAKNPQYNSYLVKVENIQEIEASKEPSKYKYVANLRSQVCEIDSRTLVPDTSCKLLP